MQGPSPLFWYETKRSERVGIKRTLTHRKSTAGMIQKLEGLAVVVRGRGGCDLRD